MSARRAAWVAILGWVAVQYLLVGGLPLFSEDYSHGARVAALDGVWQCFSHEITPPRPFLHLLLYAGIHWWEQNPWLLRLPGFACEVLAILGLARLVAAGGGTQVQALGAAALFAAFPVLKGVFWPAAIGGPGRVAFSLWALAWFATRKRSWWAGPASVACLALALLCHQSAVLIVPMLGLWIVLVERDWRALADRWLCAHAVVAAGFTLWAASVPDVHSGVVAGGAVAANVVKAACALLPEDLRFLIVEGFRRQHGAAGFVLAALLFSAHALVLLMAFWRGRALVRFVLLAGALDLLLPILKTGFSLRYASFAAALACTVLVRAGRARWLVLLLGACWLFDSMRALHDVRAAGAEISRILQVTATAARSVAPDRLLVLANPPGMWGRERDLPVCNWGLGEALRREGVTRRVRLVRTIDYLTTSDVERVPAAALAELERSPECVVIDLGAKQ